MGLLMKVHLHITYQFDHSCTCSTNLQLIHNSVIIFSNLVKDKQNHEFIWGGGGGGGAFSPLEVILPFLEIFLKIL